MSLKNIPAQLQIDSEEDLRTLVISYCSELGFDRDEISCEDSFAINLGHHSLTIGRDVIGGRSDILISRNGRALVIVETKTPSHDLSDADAQQAISYARLLSTIAPFAMVTNGRETRVYDVLADGLAMIDDPEDSIWSRNGQQNTGASDELRFEAARLLLGLDPHTLSKFCEKQVATALLDLKSGVKQNKKFIPELYVNRRALNDEYASWLQSTRPVFAVVAPSGFGKTNFICAQAEEALSSYFVLLYSASRFGTGGLLAGIRDDFIWEFQRDREGPQIFARLQAIASQAGRQLLIFIDGLDENPAGLIAMKNELLMLVARAGQYPDIRIVLSCKSFDWPHVVIENGQACNSLAETISPALRHPSQRTVSLDAENVGFHLQEFSSEEFAEAAVKYKAAYSLEGEFRGDVQAECHNPLMLRFVAEVYGETGEKLPSAVSRTELFDLYLQRKLQPIDRGNLAAMILSAVAVRILESGKRAVAKDDILKVLPWTDAHDRALEGLLRMGVLSCPQADHQEYVGFEFHRFLLYYEAFKILKLQTLPASEQVAAVRNHITSSIGLEILDFYLVAVEQDLAHTFLMELAGQDFLLLAQVLTNLTGLESYERSPFPLEHVLRYLDFYNSARDRLFAHIADATMPYARAHLGVIFLGGYHGMFRACTSAYGQPIVQVKDNELAGQFFRGPLPEQVTRELAPVGSLHIGGIHDFAKYPEKKAYEHLVREVSAALSNRLLDESATRDILQERVRAILEFEPSIWMAGDELPRGRYWQLMGFTSPEELGETKVSEVAQRVNDLLEKFRPHLQQKDALFPSYLQRSRSLLSTLYALHQMPDPDKPLGRPLCSLDTFWGRDAPGKDDFVAELARLVPSILQNYQLLFSSNLPELAAWSKFLPHVDKLTIVEVTRYPSFSDFPALSYVVCPNQQGPISPKILVTNEAHSLTRQLNVQSLNTSGYSHSYDHGCGYIELDTLIDGVHVHEPQAWVIKTRFPSRTPILDQAYSLIAHELEYLLEAKHADWRYDQSTRLGNESYVQLAAKYILEHQGRQS